MILINWGILHWPKCLYFTVWMVYLFFIHFIRLEVFLQCGPNLLLRTHSSEHTVVISVTNILCYFINVFNRPVYQQVFAISASKPAAATVGIGSTITSLLLLHSSSDGDSGLSASSPSQPGDFVAWRRETCPLGSPPQRLGREPLQ